MPSNQYSRLLMIALALAALLASCTPAQPASQGGVSNPLDPITLFVASEKAACTGAGTQDCLQVRQDPNADWELFHDPIAGFDFEPGYQYRLLVARSPAENPPADAPAFTYTLVEIVEKTAMEPTADTPDLSGTTWDLVSLGSAESLEPPPEGAYVTLGFDGERISGRAACNLYGGSYRLEGESLIWSNPYFETTEMACEEKLMQLETTYLQVLSAVDRLRLEGERLILEGPQGMLVFEKPLAASLEGTTWILNGMAERGAVVSTWVDEKIEARFEDGQIGGSAGCNRFSASYELDGERLGLGPIASTKMACESEIMERENSFLGKLAEVAAYKIERQTLTLLDSGGGFVMAFRTADSISP